LVTTVLLGLLIAGLIVAQAALLAHLLSAAAFGSGTSVLAIPLALLLGVVLARAAAAFGGELAALRAAARIKSQLRRELIAHSFRLGPTWLSRQQSGRIAAVATQGLDDLDPYFARYLPQLVLSVIVPITVIVAVSVTDWISGLIVAITLPLIPLFGALVGLHTKARTRRQWRLLSQLSGHFLDVVAGLPTLKVFGRAKAQEQVIADVTRAHRSAAMATMRVAFLSALVLELSATLATALVAVETGLRLLYGHMSYPAALLVLLLTPEAYLPLRAAATQYHASAGGAAAVESVFRVLETPLPESAAARPVHAPAAALADLSRDTLRLNQVSVRYSDRQLPALNRLSLTINPGELIVLNGPSGSGKTTLLRLLLRFIEPSEGTICATGADLATIPVEPWRAQIGWVPQHPRLFPRSVADNIALGRPGADRATVERAATLAGAAEFIESLPHGYDTRLEGPAGQLSTGERQQVALARAFVRDASMLLLDEPTAHLAPAAVAAIRRVLVGPMSGCTIILATHQDWGTAVASQVITMHGGGCSQRVPEPVPVTGSAARG
jgi:ATP-binding cassette subfamily C protein CydD